MTQVEAVPSRLTIGIPTRNRAGMVTGLVDACCRQSRDALEIVVSDNASSDDTVMRLKRIPYPDLTVLSQSTNIGMVGNWNACLEQARGEWFVLLSDDDLVDVDFVATVEDTIAKSTGSDVIFMRCRVLNRMTNNLYDNAPPVADTGQIDVFDELIPAWLDGSFTIAFAGVVFRTQKLREFGGFSGMLPFAADVATWLPIAAAGRSSFCAEAKVTYVIHNDMSTQQFRMEMLIDDVLAIAAMLRKIVGEAARLPEEKKRDLTRRCDRYVNTRFNSIMIMGARRRLPKRHLLGMWRKYGHQVPRFGFGVLAVGAVVVPFRLMQVVGWPYRAWAARRSRQEADHGG